jgi:hypothetical protein
MRKPVRVAALILSALAVNASGTAAQAPAAGTYTCYTYQISSQLQQRWRTRPLHMEQELAQVLAQSTNIVPAGIGVALDGRGRYRIVGARGAGGYRFDAATEKLAFDGEAVALKFQKYFVTRGGTSVLQFYPNPDVFYQCELSGRSAPAGGSSSGGASQQAPPDLPPPTASDWTGRFEGTYSCGSHTSTPIQFLLTTNSMGKLMGEVRFGGGDGVPRGSYTVEGVRTGTVFMLSAIRWLEQPDGYILTDFDGRLTGTTLAGRVLSNGCNGFTTTKVR